MNTLLTPQERKSLKARAHHLDPVVIVGNAGLTPAVLREIDAALKTRELIKVRVLGEDRAAREQVSHEVCTLLSASPVQNIGKLLVFHRPRPAETPTQVKVKKPRGPRKTKKQLGVARA